jgi:UDP:flavonoid glycosyltransferase YjiC (YdhE family)
MRIVLSGEGTRGDLQPLVELGARLGAAGHDALVCGPPDFVAQAAERGVAYRVIGIGVRDFLNSRAAVISGGSAAGMMREAIAHLREQLRTRIADLAAVTRDADLIVAAGPEMAASSAAELNGVAYRYVAYCPALFPSREFAPLFLPWQAMPGWANRLAWPLAMTPLTVAVRRLLAPARRSVGLPPERDVLRLFFGERPLLAVESVLARAPADAPVALQQVPALHPLAGDPLPAKLASFLDAGPPPVYFGFGSMPDADAAKTTRTILDAVATLGCRAVIGSGWADLGGGALPEGVIAVGAVSHPELFARCAAIVHHGGAGTTTNAARSGVPQLVVPHLMDQFYWGRRVNLLGLGPPPLRKRQFRADRLVASLGAMLDNEALAERSREIGDRLRAEACSIDPVAALIPAGV